MRSCSLSQPAGRTEPSGKKWNALGARGARFLITDVGSGSVRDAAHTVVLEEKRKGPTGRDEARLTRPSRFIKWRRVEKALVRGSMFDSCVQFAANST